LTADHAGSGQWRDSPLARPRAGGAWADLVIEAVPEDIDLRRTFFPGDLFCGEDTILATNTSSISISDLASQSSAAIASVGLHFFNPRM